MSKGSLGSSKATASSGNDVYAFNGQAPRDPQPPKQLSVLWRMQVRAAWSSRHSMSIQSAGSCGCSSEGREDDPVEAVIAML